MPALPSSSPQIYLVKEAEELVLRQGANPNRMQNAGTRILIVGGGVTGLTVGTLLYHPRAVNS